MNGAQRSVGTVSYWNESRGFGFIQFDVGDEDVFFHVSEWVDDDVPGKGDRVSFVEAPGRNRKPCARQVTRA